MKLKDNYRLPQPVRIGWLFESEYWYETVTGTVSESGNTQWFDYSDKTRIATSEEECRLRSAADGVPLLDITGWEIGWIPEDERVIRFIAKHNPDAVIGPDLF